MEPDERRVGIYFGESRRSLYERSCEHVKDAEKFKEGSHIINHWKKYHKEDDSRPPFSFKILDSFKDCLSRQVGEAIRIHYAKDELLDSKNEYNDNLPEGWKVTAPCKRLKRMSPEEEETIDMVEWWKMAEGMCLRAGKL